MRKRAGVTKEWSPEEAAQEWKESLKVTPEDLAHMGEEQADKIRQKRFKLYMELYGVDAETCQWVYAGLKALPGDIVTKIDTAIVAGIQKDLETATKAMERYFLKVMQSEPDPVELSEEELKQVLEADEFLSWEEFVADAFSKACDELYEDDAELADREKRRG